MSRRRGRVRLCSRWPIASYVPKPVSSLGCHAQTHRQNAFEFSRGLIGGMGMPAESGRCSLNKCPSPRSGFARNREHIGGRLDTRKFRLPQPPCAAHAQSIVSATRNPTRSDFLSGGICPRLDERHNSGRRSNDPPRTTRVAPSSGPVGSVAASAGYSP